MSFVVDDYRRGEAGARVAVAAASWSKRQAFFTLAGLSIVFVTSTVWLPPDEPTFVLCPFRFLTGLPCPGCGMTRAFCHLAHGHFVSALQFNPFSFFVFLAAIIAWLKAAAVLFDLQALRAKLSVLRFSQRAGKFALMLVVIWWITRLAGDF